MRRNEISEEICFYCIFFVCCFDGLDLDTLTCAIKSKTRIFCLTFPCFGAAKNLEMRSVKDMFAWHLFGNLFPIGLSAVS